MAAARSEKTAVPGFHIHCWCCGRYREPDDLDPETRRCVQECFKVAARRKAGRPKLTRKQREAMGIFS